MARQSTVDAAILARVGSAFAIEQTSVRGSDGKRIIGSRLESGLPSVSSLLSGEDFSGIVELGGLRFIAELSPLSNGEGEVIGALFVGQSIAAVDEITAEGYRAVLVRILVGTLIAVVLSGLVAAIGLRSSIMPLRRTVELLGEIAREGGDLSRRIEGGGGDETGELARQFNAFAERLRLEFARMKTEATKLHENAAELERISDSTARAVGSISEEIAVVRDRVIEQSASVVESTSAVEQIVGNIGALDRRIADEATAIDGSSASIARMAEGVESTTERVADLVARVGRLKLSSQEGVEAIEESAAAVAETARQSERLFELNDLIASVSSRTDLLAMNAAIEAAHAGEAGKGFAVVAEEIRRLAEESAEGAREAEAELKAVKESIDRIVSASAMAESAFERIGSSILDADAGLEGIAAQMAGQREGIVEVLASLEIMRRATTTITDGSAEMRSGGALVLEEMRRLSGLSTTIEEGVSSIATQAGTIAEEAAAAAAAARVNDASAASLEAALAPYKTEA